MAKNTEKNSKEYNRTARKKYRKESVKTVNVLFNLETEKHLLDYLNKQESKSGYLKKLLADDMNK